MIDRLQALQEEALAALDAVQDRAALDAWRVRFLGRRGALAILMAGLGQLSFAERPAVG